MKRKGLSGSALLLLGLVAVGAALFISNATPEVPQVPAAEAAHPTKPYVVKLHAQWCPICMLTKGEWADIETAYADRVNLVVFDATTASDVDRSRAEAERLGLADAVDRYHGATGVVLVIDPATREVVAEIAGVHPIEDYRAAIDAALSPPER